MTKNMSRPTENIPKVIMIDYREPSFPRNSAKSNAGRNDIRRSIGNLYPSI